MNGGTKVAVQEFDMTAELLMRQLLKLDGIEAEGDAKVQRKAEVSFWFITLFICVNNKHVYMIRMLIELEDI